MVDTPVVKKPIHWRTIIGGVIIAAGIVMKANPITAPMADITVSVGFAIGAYGVGNWRGNAGLK